MPSLDVFAPVTEDSVRRALTRNRGTMREQMSQDYDRAVDYLENRQLDDVRSGLRMRYERTQQGRRGQNIAPQFVPMVQRFADEAAVVYRSSKIERKVVDADGSVDKALTEQVRAFLGRSGFDERMAHIERRLVLLKSSGVMFSARRGKLKVEGVLPQSLFLIAPEDREFFDPTDQDDYEAFVVESSERGDGGKSRFAYVAPSGTVFYAATGPYESPEQFSAYRNAIRWPQVIDTADGRGQTRTLPLQMLGVAHLEQPSGGVIVNTDVPIVECNRELNLQLSMVLDTIAHQGWATPVYHALNPDTAPAVMAAGPRFGLTVGVEETLEMLTSSVSYTEIISALESFVKLVAIFESMSPNDFSLASGATPSSGFAKMVDSLPRIERRARQAERLSRFEAEVAWPRIAAAGAAIGAIDGTVEQLSQFKLVTKFGDMQWPESPSEKIQREKHEIEIGTSSPSRILSARDGVSVEEAAEIVRENMASSRAKQEGQAGQENGAALQNQSQRSGLLESLIRRRG